jgi:hypothetical protein
MIDLLNPRAAPVGRVKSREGFQQWLPTKHHESFSRETQKSVRQLNDISSK